MHLCQPEQSDWLYLTPGIFHESVFEAVFRLNTSGTLKKEIYLLQVYGKGGIDRMKYRLGGLRNIFEQS